MKDCPNCDNAGKTFYRRHHCDTCGGSGYVYSPPPVSKTPAKAEAAQPLPPNVIPIRRKVA